MTASRSPFAAEAQPGDGPGRQRIVVVDDDPDLRELIGRLLKDGGYDVAALPDGRELLREIARGAPDLLILDVMLPGADGFDLCRQLRQHGHDLPIIMLTARDEEIDRVLGLELGADDYVTKPFSGREMLARIKAVLRRRHEGAVRRTPPVYHFAGWTFRPDKMEIVSEDGLSVMLSATEAALLRTFVTHPGRTLSRDDLSELSKGYISGPFSRSLDTQVSRLRRKLRPEGPAPEMMIRTVWGRGYMFAVEVEIE